MTTHTLLSATCGHEEAKKGLILYFVSPSFAINKWVWLVKGGGGGSLGRGHTEDGQLRGVCVTVSSVIANVLYLETGCSHCCLSHTQTRQWGFQFRCHLCYTGNNCKVYEGRQWKNCLIKCQQAFQELLWVEG